MRASLGLTGAISDEDLDAGTPGLSSERDGFDSGLPHLQMRAGLKLDGFVEKKQMELGAWGALGRTETDTAFGGETEFDVQLAGFDFQVPFSAALSLRGEGWTGENLGDFRGGIGQSVNPGTGQEISAVGGWAELAYLASERTKFHVGATIDVGPGSAPVGPRCSPRSTGGASELESVAGTDPWTGHKIASKAIRQASVMAGIGTPAHAIDPNAPQRAWTDSVHGVTPGIRAPDGAPPSAGLTSGYRPHPR